jgi:hypothetical protein
MDVKNEAFRLNSVRQLIYTSVKKYEGNDKIKSKYVWLAKYFNDYVSKIPGLEVNKIVHASGCNLFKF